MTNKDIEETVEKLKKNKDFTGAEPPYQFFETLCAGNTCATRLSSDGEKWLTHALTTTRTKAIEEERGRCIKIIDKKLGGIKRIGSYDVTSRMTDLVEIKQALQDKK